MSDERKGVFIYKNVLGNHVFYLNFIIIRFLFYGFSLFLQNHLFPDTFLYGSVSEQILQNMKKKI